MYRCQKCNKITQPNEKENKLVVGTRKVQYVNKVKDKNDKRGKKLFEKISYGTEITKEISICDECAGIKKREYINTSKNTKVDKVVGDQSNKLIYTTAKHPSKNTPLEELKYLLRGN